MVAFGISGDARIMASIMTILANDNDNAGLATEERLRAAYVQVARREATQIELRARVCEFVAHLRSQSLPPEAVLIRLKRVLADRLGAMRDLPTIFVRSALNEQIIRWCIEEYYRPQSP